MNPAIPILAELLVLFCSSCENKKAKEAELRVVELEEKQAALETEINAKKALLLDWDREKSQAIRAREALEKKDQEFFEEVRERLTAIEPGHAKTIKFDQPGESLIAKLKGIEEENRVEVAKKEKENESMAMRLSLDIVPANRMMDLYASEIPSINEKIEALEKEIELLKK